MFADGGAPGRLDLDAGRDRRFRFLAFERPFRLLRRGDGEAEINPAIPCPDRRAFRHGPTVPVSDCAAQFKELCAASPLGWAAVPALASAHTLSTIFRFLYSSSTPRRNSRAVSAKCASAANSTMGMPAIRTASMTVPV